MAWVRIDDHFDEHPKHAMIGPLGWGVWLAGLAYCNRNLTDGFIPRSVALTLACFEVVDSEGRVWRLARTSGMVGEDVDMRWVIDLLVEVGLWEEVPGGYRVHDYADYQPTKDAVLKERAQTAERVRRLRASRSRAGNDISSADVTPLQTELQAESNAISTPSPNPNPNPNPIPNPKGDIPPANAPPKGGQETRGARRSDEPNEPYSADFEAFWAIYPRHVAKKAAWKQWRAQLRKGRSLDELITAASHYADACRGKDEQYIMHAATFLGPSDRWQDYLHPPTRASPAKTMPPAFRSLFEYARGEDEPP